MTESTGTATTPPAAAPSSQPTASSHGHERGVLEQAATAAMLPVTVARQLLPDNPVPVALGAGALAVAGVIEWPVAAAVGLGYLALRRWAPLAAGHSPERKAGSSDRKSV